MRASTTTRQTISAQQLLDECVLYCRAVNSPIFFVVQAKFLGPIAAAWGVLGFIALLAYAVYRLTPITYASFDHDWHWYHWLVAIANLLFMAYSEGYRGFQKGYSPRLAARAHHLLNHATVLTTLLAPLYCMNYFAAERRRVLSAWILTVAIVILIIVVHHLPQPWRGLLDAGVLVGLSWGIVATLVCCNETFLNGHSNSKALSRQS